MQKGKDTFSSHPTFLFHPSVRKKKNEKRFFEFFVSTLLKFTLGKNFGMYFPKFFACWRSEKETWGMGRETFKGK
jgi:hypothetical protein